MQASVPRRARVMLVRWILHAQALCASSTVAPAVPTGTEFFVDAVHGDDGASGGSPSSAFATLRRAQLAVRQVSRSRQAASGDETQRSQTPLATVSLRSAGIHWVHRGINATVALQSAPAPLTFSGPDSGTAQHHVVWRTHPSDVGSAVVSAGFPVPQKWKPTAADPGLYEVHVPDVAAGFACPQQLWAGAKRLTRARLPHTGFLQWVSALNPTNYSDKINSHGFVYSPEFAPTAAKILAAHTGNTLRAANITVVTMHIWGDSHSILDSINVTARSLHWIAPSSTPIGLYESGMPGSTGRRFFLDNTALGLDAAGSWHIDCDSGLMRYRPRGGEHPNAMEFVAAGANEVVVFGNPADTDIGAAHSLHGAIQRHKLAYLPTMRHSDTVDPCGDPAREVRSAANRVAIAHSANAQSTTKDMIASNIVLENLVLSHNNYACPTGRACGGSDAGFQSTAALRIAHGVNVTISGVDVVHTSSYGAWLQGGTSNRFVNLYLADLGSGGLRIAEGSVASGNHTIRGCNITDGGHVFRAGAGIHATRTDDNVIEDNHVSGFAASGIIVRIGNRNIIQRNYVQNLGLGMLSDFGGVCFSYGTEGSIAVQNVIGGGFNPYDYGAHGMYSDMCNTGSTFIGNQVWGTATAGYQMHYGWNVTVADNSFSGGFIAKPGDSVIYANPSPTMGAAFVFINNTVLHDTNATLLQVDLTRAKAANYTFKNNHYMIKGTGRVQFNAVGGKLNGWGAWRAIGQDIGSTCSDHGVPCTASKGICCCCWDRSAQPCNSSNQCDGGGEGCVSKGTPTKRYGPANCECDGVSHGCA